MRRSRRLIAALIFGTSCASLPATAQAQVPVIDALNIIEAAKTGYNTYESLQQLLKQYELLVSMGRRAADMGRYQTPAVPVIFHDPSRYVAGAAFLRGLNAGDPTGQIYDSVIRTALRPEPVFGLMTPMARRDFERAYATIDIADSTGAMAEHQVGHVRGYTQAATAAIQTLEADTLGGPDNEHFETAIIDRINAAQIIARRQDTSINELLSHLVEQWLVDTKRKRDTEAVAMNMRIGRIQNYRAYSATFFTASSEAEASAWRQP
jgi:hypothetical protein